MSNNVYQNGIFNTFPFLMAIPCVVQHFVASTPKKSKTCRTIKVLRYLLLLILNLELFSISFKITASTVSVFSKNVNQSFHSCFRWTIVNTSLTQWRGLSDHLVNTLLPLRPRATKRSRSAPTCTQGTSLYTNLGDAHCRGHCTSVSVTSYCKLILVIDSLCWEQMEV